MTKPTDPVPATTGDASSAPTTASKGGGLPTVSGSGPGEWNNALLAGIVQVCAGRDLGDNGALEKARAGIAAMKGIGPDDVIADMVAAQLVSAHHAAMDCYKLAVVPDQPFEAWREALNQANRLSRTSASLIEALNRHRGKGSQQRVVVEHVNVAAGGQAIVGAVATGGGDDRSGEYPCHARSSTVRSADAARDAMPGAGDGERAMPDARREAARRPARQPPCVEAWPLLARGDRAPAGGHGAGTFDARARAPDRDVNRWRTR